MCQIAATDSTFEQMAEQWLGKCLICNGKLGFHIRSGYGANIEHILSRVLGGTSEIKNLGLTHSRCNGEKGRHWDAPRQHRSSERNAAYWAIVERLQARRTERWRELGTSS